MTTNNSQKLYQMACRYMPGGVSSPVRAFKAVGLTPIFIDHALGSRIFDVDGNEYIDYVCSFGPLILGHSHPRVVEAICRAARRGTSYGACCEGEVELAELICHAIPSVEKVRLVNSGTEATMSAIRLARAYTGRNHILKFEGCYHGHADAFLIKAGSGLLTAGVPNSPGIPDDVAGDTLIAQYNDLESVQALFAAYGNDIAAVIVEPVAGNMGLVLPEPGFLQGLRRITAANDSLLIFDEVITGFRLTYGGFQNISGIIPDLTTLGKIIGGGLPVGAYGGRADIMDMVSPQGNVYQAGTLSGNPLAMAAGITTLKILQEPGFYEHIEDLTGTLTGKLKQVFARSNIAVTINTIGSMFAVFFTHAKVNNYETVKSCNTSLYARIYRSLLQEKIYLPPSQFEVGFISSAHNRDDVDFTVDAVERALAKAVQEGDLF